MEKPDLGTAALRDIVKYAVFQSNKKAEEERIQKQAQVEHPGQAMLSGTVRVSRVSCMGAGSKATPAALWTARDPRYLPAQGEGCDPRPACKSSACSGYQDGPDPPPAQLPCCCSA